MRKTFLLDHKNTFALLLSFAIILLAVLSYSHIVYVQSQQQILDSLYEISSQSKEVLTKEIRCNQEVIANLATLIGNAGMMEDPELWDYLEAVNQRNRFKRMGVIFPDGTSRTSDNEPMYLGDRTYFRHSMAGRSAVSDTLTDKIGGGEINVCSAPIWNGDSVAGVLFATYPTEYYRQILSVSTFDGFGFSYVTKSNGDRVVGSGHQDSLGDFKNIFSAVRELDPDNTASALQIQEDMAAGSSGYVIYNRKGQERYLYYQPLGVNDWYLLSVVPLAVASSSRNQMLLGTYLFTAMCVAVFLLLMYSLFKTRDNSRKALEKIAYVDSVTGGYTFARFRGEASALLAQSPRAPYAAVYLDIDRFGLINDLFGHEEGDRILVLLHQLIREQLDTGELFGRVNADHFALLMKFGGEETLRSRLEELGRKFQRRCSDRGTRFSMKLSIGVYLIEDNRDANLIDVFDRAKIPHRQAKGSQIDQIVFYDSGLRRANLRAKEIENRFQQALEHNEFTIYYQAKYDPRRRRFNGAEALVRWLEPDKGLVGPDEFIPVLEQNGDIVRLDEYVFRSVCRQIRQWLDQGYKIAPISVNISRLHLYQVDFVKNYVNTVAAFNLPVSLVQLEFTETIMLGQDDILLDTVRQLQQCGFKILLDDFGSGYSSLNMLNHLPIDTLKIDKTLIDDSGCRASTRKIITNLINLSRDLGMDVVAEGVETKEQFDFLLETGCDYIQGYYCARPVPAAEYTSLLEKADGRSEPGTASAKE